MYSRQGKGEAHSGCARYQPRHSATLLASLQAELPVGLRPACKSGPRCILHLHPDLTAGPVQSPRRFMAGEVILAILAEGLALVIGSRISRSHLFEGEFRDRLVPWSVSLPQAIAVA